MTETQETTALTLANIVQLTLDIVKKSDGNGFKIPQDLESDMVLTDTIHRITQSKLTLLQGGQL